MTQTTIGVVVEKSRDNLVFVTEIQTGRAFVVTDKAAKAYQNGNILTELGRSRPSSIGG